MIMGGYRCERPELAGTRLFLGTEIASGSAREVLEHMIRMFEADGVG